MEDMLVITLEIEKNGELWQLRKALPLLEINKYKGNLVGAIADMQYRELRAEVDLDLANE